MKNDFKSHYTYYILLATLFILAFLERTVFDFGPNIELLTSAIIVSSLFANRLYLFLSTFITLIASDFLIGNTSIFLFTWSGFLIPAIFSKKILSFLRLVLRLKFFPMLGLGLFSNFFFYIWTNLGVWLLDSWGMYTHDIHGLIRCYINAIPFLKNQLLSSLIFIPVFYFFVEGVLKFTSSKKGFSSIIPKLQYNLDHKRDC